MRIMFHKKNFIPFFQVKKSWKFAYLNWSFNRRNVVHYSREKGSINTNKNLSPLNARFSTPIRQNFDSKLSIHISTQNQFPVYHHFHIITIYFYRKLSLIDSHNKIENQFGYTPLINLPQRNTHPNFYFLCSCLLLFLSCNWCSNYL